MNKLKTAIISAILVLSTSSIAQDRANYEIDFTQAQEAKAWVITNDSVMGGKSQGQFSFVDKASLFSGYISLENNGGFSSVFRDITSELSNNLNTIQLDMLGDGLTYQVRLAVFIDGYRITYKHDFATIAGTRQRVELRLNQFQASYRGRIIENAPKLKPEHIAQVGFLITNKAQSEFNLRVFTLKVIDDDLKRTRTEQSVTSIMDSPFDAQFALTNTQPRPALALVGSD